MTSPKTFLAISFGCRVNAAETNQWSQMLLNQGFVPTKNQTPHIIIINTCAITKKGEKESLNKIKQLHKKYSKSQIYVTGCASFKKIEQLPNIKLFNNNQKEEFLKNLKSFYTSKIKDKFSNTHRYILKIQSGCTQFCSYCIVPFRRNYLQSLTINDAVKTVNKITKNGYKELIITGVNLDQYKPGLSNLLEKLLQKTNIKLISFGSIPISCLDNKFIKLIKKYPNRVHLFFHIPIQSGSNKILKLMNRPYTKKDILQKIQKLKASIPDLKLGTDIIVGFPTETEKDFKETLNLCKKIGFSKIHTFPFSPRPGTKARIIHQNSPKITKEILKSRSSQIRNIIAQNKLPSHQKPET
jgi:threonylcarbamoyladenosine tRNA methylthiotransferase MtaB